MGARSQEHLSLQFLFDLIKPNLTHGPWIAGSCPMAMVQGRPIMGTGHDIDVFTATDDQYDRLVAIFSELSELGARTEKTRVVESRTVSNKATTFKTTIPKLPELLDLSLAINRYSTTSHRSQLFANFFEDAKRVIKSASELEIAKAQDKTDNFIFELTSEYDASYHDAYGLDGRSIAVQIIRPGMSVDGTLESLLNRFEIRACQIATDGVVFAFTCPEVLDDLVHRRLTLARQGEITTHGISRILKYIAYGYQVSDEELDGYIREWLTKPNIFEDERNGNAFSGAY